MVPTVASLTHRHDTFGGYLTNPKNWAPSALLAIIVFLLKNKSAAALVVAALGFLGLSSFSAGGVERIEDLLQALAILWLIVLTAQVSVAHRRRDCQAAEEATAAFRTWWLATLGALCLLYVSLFLKDIGVVPGIPARAMTIVCSYASTYTLIILYQLMSRRTGRVDSTHAVVWAIALLVLMVVETCMVTGGLLRDRPTGWLSAVTSGVSMCMFFARLESQRIAAPTWAIATLYCYALLQMLAPLQDVTGETWAAIWLTARVVALPLKILMALVIHWILDNQILLYYFKRAAAVDEEQRMRRAEFLRSYRLGGGVESATASA